MICPTSRNVLRKCCCVSSRRFACQADDSEKNILNEKSKVKVKSFDEIPGPKPLPLIGNLWRYLPFVGEYSFNKLHRTYEKMHKQFGPLVKEKIIGDRVIVHVFSPDDMFSVYKNEGRRPFRRSHQALGKYRKERPSVYNRTGLFPSNGEEWYNFRHLFQNILMSPANASGCSNAVEDVTEDLLARIPKLLDENNEVDLQPELFKWALECIGVITLNRRLGCLSSQGNKEATKLVKAANEIHKTVFITENSPLYKYIRTPSYSRLVSAQDYLASVVDKYMKEAIVDMTKKEQCQSSLLQSMLAIPEADYKDVFTMVLDMFLAGIDTTAYTTAFGLYNLSKNQRVQDILRAELIKHMPHKWTRLSDVKEKMPYLQYVIKESLRVNPVAVGTGRVLPSDITLSGYNVPAGTMVILQHQVASIQEETYWKPEVFLPERWMKDFDSVKPLNSFVSSPFGYGPRVCIGMRFAQREMFLALGKLIRNFRIEYYYEDIDSCNRLINVPDKPLRLRFYPIDQ